MLKHVITTERRVPRFAGLPGSEGAIAMNLTRRPGIFQQGMIFHGRAGAARGQFQIVDRKPERNFHRVARQHDENCILHRNVLDEHGGFRMVCLFGHVVGGRREPRPLALGWNVDFQAFQCDRGNHLGSVEQSSQIDRETELADGEQRRDVAAALLPH